MREIKENKKRQCRSIHRTKEQEKLQCCLDHGHSGDHWHISGVRWKRRKRIEAPKLPIIEESKSKEETL